MIDKLKKEYDKQWAAGIRPPVLKLTKKELQQYKKECSDFWKKKGYSGKLSDMQFFRDAMLQLII